MHIHMVRIVDNPDLSGVEMGEGKCRPRGVISWQGYGGPYAMSRAGLDGHPRMLGGMDDEDEVRGILYYMYRAAARGNALLGSEFWLRARRAMGPKDVREAAG